MVGRLAGREHQQYGSMRRTWPGLTGQDPNLFKSCHCQRYNCTVQEYRSDNGIFTYKDFTENLAQHGQRHTVAGTGAHHMNGIAERCIGFISTWTLTILLHAQAQWPQIINKSFWPFATRHAVNIYVNCYRG